jgi:hypothetical protein
VKRRPDGWGYSHPLTGLLRCADCGGKLYFHRITNGKDRPMYICSNYHKIPVGSKCVSPHRVDADTVTEPVASTLRRVVKIAIEDKDAFRKSVLEKLSEQHSDGVKKQKKRLAVVTKRIGDLEILQRKIYEDNALGKLPDKRYAEMSEGYDREQSELEREQTELRSAVDAFLDGGERADRFIKLIEKYESFDELGVAALNELEEKIVVHERGRKGSAQTTQRIDIHLAFIGEYDFPPEEIDPDELTKRKEEQHKIEERKDRLHRNYLRRKENGNQVDYERKYEPLRKVRFQECKAAAKVEVAALAEVEGKAPIWKSAAGE